MKKIHYVLIVALFFYFESISQNVGINTTGATPNNSTILDLNTGNTFTSPNGKGLLIPNVALTSTSDATTITSPATSLLVYNTATASSGATAVTPGYYYWTGSAWSRLQNGNSSTGWLTTGNSGTTVGTNFLGTTDAQAFMIKVNNIQSGYIDYTADGNTALGYQTLINNTGGYQNSAFGYNVLQSNTTGSDNTGLGYQSLLFNTSGYGNSALGSRSLNNNTTGYDNTAIGHQTLAGNTTGSDNSSFGNNALSSNTTGYENSALGSSALQANSTGNDNIAVGVNALFSNTIGNDNIGIGHSALYANKTAINNIAIGSWGLYHNTSGSQNTAIGSNAIISNISGNDNVAIGYSVLYNNTTGDNNTSVGSQALFSNTTASGNTAIGSQSLSSNTTASGNTAIGYQSLYANTTGSNNTANGSIALNSNTTGYNNTANGSGTLTNNTTGRSNSAFGYAALQANTTASCNTAYGSQSLFSNTTGSNNTATGFNALVSNTTGSNNVVNGSGALSNNTTASNNVVEGYLSFFTNVTGSNNVSMGYQSGYLATGSGNIFLGYQAGYNETNNNKLYIDNSNSTTPLVYGDFSTNLLQVNGTLNINNVYSLPTVAGTANYILQTNGAGTTSWVNPTSLSITETDPQVSSSTTNYIPKWNGSSLVDGLIYDNATAIGVGTTTPTQAKLVVNGSQNFTTAYGYLNSSGSIGTSGSATNAYSIYASSRIAAAEFNAFSDARIKKIKGLSNSKTDLETLANVRITNYTFIDTIAKGSKLIKKVIAQELEKIYPQAVSTHIDIVPDIYKQAEINLNGLINLPNTLKAGDKVKIIFATGEELVEVISADEKGFQVKTNKTGKVFVYGKEVPDFHTVDYEALTTLNISATQELLKRIEFLEKENNNLKNQMQTVVSLKNEIDALKLFLYSAKQ